MKLPWPVWAAASGVLLACAFPPIGWSWLVWIGLVPLCVVIIRGTAPAWAAAGLAGLAFFLIAGHPLTSAHSWSGWSSESYAEYGQRLSRQWWWLHGLWIGFALWCALTWIAWGVLTRRLAKGPASGRAGQQRDQPWRWVAAGCALWVLCEWLRARMTFGCTWAFLGNALAGQGALRQLAALGGVWLLTLLPCAVNMALALALVQGWQRSRRLVWAVAGVVAVAGAFGACRLAAVPVGGGATAAVVQYYEGRPGAGLEGHTPIGLDRDYLPLVQHALRSSAELIVLPESIVWGAVSLDRTPSRVKPEEAEMPAGIWDQQMAQWLGERPVVMILGMDTVEGGHDYNSLVVWSAGARIGRYHKRRLVPFAEYHPAGLAGLPVRGRTDYVAGRGSQLIRTNGLVLGGLICQEVVYPELVRQTVRDGATILVSGAQDGVFSDPAVADIQADLAQLRAVESGRFLVRAVKQGTAAIIDPAGRQVTAALSGHPAVITARVAAREGWTPYVRWGDWVLWAAAGMVLVAVVSPQSPPKRRRSRRRRPREIMRAS